MLKLVCTKDSAFWSASKAYTQRPTMETRVPQKADGNRSAPVLSGTGNAEISNQFVVFWLGAWNVRAWTGTGRETRPGRHRAGQFVLSGKNGRSSLGSGPPDLHYGKNVFVLSGVERTGPPGGGPAVSPDRPGRRRGRARGRQSDGRIGGWPVRGDDQPADGLAAAAVLAKSVWQAPAAWRELEAVTERVQFPWG